MHRMPLIAHVAGVGLGATAVMDLWLILLSRLGLPSSGFGLVGRWVGHFAQGRFVHAGIARSQPLRHEQALGWMTHYAVGLVYAALLAAVVGEGWFSQPTLIPAVAFGALTVVAPWFVMQPAMGAGFMASRTPDPLKNALRSLANHTVFGIGLYLAAAALHSITPLEITP